uniref:Glycosyl transferase family 1 domain-containing protein n=1 Tax=viral metagenome TaxID=1070528 RepID=A0A6C0JHV5_9ZZZZ
MKNANDAKKLPKDFNWKTYVKLNKDLRNLKNKKEAIKHYIDFGINEKRKYKINLPIDFNWKYYIKVNDDLKEITSKQDAINHYTNFGFYENRDYKEEEECEILYDLLVSEKISKNDTLFFILSEFIRKNIKNSKNFIKPNNTTTNTKTTTTNTKTTTTNTKTKTNEEIYLDSPCNVIYNIVDNIIDNIIDKIVDKYTDDERCNHREDNLLSNTYNSLLLMQQQQELIFLDYKLSEISNIYEDFIVIFDLPDHFYGGTKFFINSIIEKYKNIQNFLILYATKNNTIKVNINNKYFLNSEYNETSIKNILQKIQNKIKKIFINHTYGFSEDLINFLFNLKKKISIITHDHYLFNNKTQLMYYEINECIYKNKNIKYDFRLFENIITQNTQNLYLFKTTPNLKNIVVTELPDLKCSDETITTDNKHTIIGIIGYISNIKGSEFIKFLIKIFKDTDVKIVIFGKMTGSNYKHCYPYNSINELNDLLKLYKPNMLVECSLWPETYSYTLSLSMLTDLPILILKKHFSSVIENRAENYKKKFYFDNIDEFLILIDNNKQNYFKTIKPVIYYNKFWDDYFESEPYAYGNFIKNNINKIQEVNNKNVILITSKIYVSTTQFSYSKTRSVYSFEERFKQTLKTIASLKKKIPDYFIVLFDNSTFTKEEKNILDKSVDCFINITNNETLNYYTNKCKYKYLSELFQQINSYHYFFKFIDHTKIKNFFKITGRYYMNNDFKYNNYNNNLNIFKKNITVKERDYYYTSFFKISNNFLPEYFLKLIDIYENKGDYFNLDLEVIYGKCFLENMKLVDKLGVTQLISCWSEKSKI